MAPCAVRRRAPQEEERYIKAEKARLKARMGLPNVTSVRKGRGWARRAKAPAAG